TYVCAWQHSAKKENAVNNSFFMCLYVYVSGYGYKVFCVLQSIGFNKPYCFANNFHFIRSKIIISCMITFKATWNTIIHQMTYFVVKSIETCGWESTIKTR